MEKVFDTYVGRYVACMCVWGRAGRVGPTGKERSESSSCRGMAAVVCVTPAKIVGEATTNLPRCLLQVCQFFTAPSPALNAPSTPGSRGTDSSNKLEKTLRQYKIHPFWHRILNSDGLWRNVDTMSLLSPCKAHLGLRC